MKLTEIRQGEEITLEVIINGARYEFKSDMVDAADGGRHIRITGKSTG